MAPVMVLLLLATSAIRNGGGTRWRRADEQYRRTPAIKAFQCSLKDRPRVQKVASHFAKPWWRPAATKHAGRTHTAFFQKEHKIGGVVRTASVASDQSLGNLGKRRKMPISDLGPRVLMIPALCVQVYDLLPVWPPAVGVHAHAFFRPLGAETLFGASCLHDLGRLLWLQICPIAVAAVCLNRANNLHQKEPDSAAVSCEQLQVAGLHSSGVALRVVKSGETLKCLSSLSHRESQPIGEKALFEQSEYLGSRGNKN